MRALNNIMVTGGAGFIGSNFIRTLLDNPEFEGRIINYDKLTYAGNPLSLKDMEEAFGGSRYFLEVADICDRAAVEAVLQKYDIDTIVHLAAESHVDRSIEGPEAFIQTNVMGTFTLLDAARKYWTGRTDVLFHHVSTDEVFGSLGESGFFTEDTPYDPRSPYSASKASSDHLVQAYYHTYNLPVTMSNCSNNYGPFQFPEKLIPVMIENMLAGLPLPVYGDGKNIRDWLYVVDHNTAVWTIMNDGEKGRSYNIGGENEWENIRLVEVMCEIVADETGKEKDFYKNLIQFVNDRPGHDQRYAIDCSRIKKELAWKQSVSFDEGLKKTICWYLENREWVAGIKSGEYLRWMEKNYSCR